MILLLSSNSYYDRPVCDAVYYDSNVQFHSKEIPESFCRTYSEAAGFFKLLSPICQKKTACPL